MLNLEGRVAAVFGLANKPASPGASPPSCMRPGRSWRSAIERAHEVEALGLIEESGGGAVPVRCVERRGDRSVFAQIKEKYGS